MSSEKAQEGAGEIVSPASLLIRYKKSALVLAFDADTRTRTASDAVWEAYQRGLDRCVTADAMPAYLRRWAVWERRIALTVANMCRNRGEAYADPGVLSDAQDALVAWLVGELARYGTDDATVPPLTLGTDDRRDATDTSDRTEAGRAAPATRGGGAGGRSDGRPAGGVATGHGGHAALDDGGAAVEGRRSPGADRAPGGRGAGAPHAPTGRPGAGRVTAFDLSEEWSTLTGGVRTLDPAELEPVDEDTAETDEAPRAGGVR